MKSRISAEHDRLPDLATLSSGLRHALREAGHARHEVHVVRRIPNKYASSFGSEKVLCNVDGEIVRLFCKYGLPRTRETEADPSNLTYEVALYRNLLRHLPLSTPRYMGAVMSGWPHVPWLILEDIEPSCRVAHVSSTGSMEKAAAWIGTFHAKSRTYLHHPPLDFVHRMSLSDYVAPVERIEGQVADDFPRWLGQLCLDYRRLAPRLCGRDAIIHGEYTPMNVLTREGRIYPVDWQAAKIGAPEVDLAMLADCWPKRLVESMRGAYSRARWGNRVPAYFGPRFQAARIYVHLYWLSLHPRSEGKRPRLEAMRGEARRLGIKAA